MARVPSMGRQVELALKEISGIGESKKSRREELGQRSIESNQLISDKIHSFKTMTNIRRELTDLAKYAKQEHEIKELSEINIDIVKDWLDSKTIQFETASNYLSNLNKVSTFLNITPKETLEVRKELSETLARGNLGPRAYKDLDTLKINPVSEPAFQLQRDHGLRKGAAIHVNLTKQLDKNILTFKEKGGKLSKIELSHTLVSLLEKNALNGIYSINDKRYYRHLEKAIKETGQEYNGTHGIRHAFAQRLLEEGKSFAEVSEKMGHERPEITLVYLR